METISVRIRKDTYKKLVALAEADFRPITGQIEVVVQEYIDNHPLHPLEQHVKQPVTNGRKS